MSVPKDKHGVYLWHAITRNSWTLTVKGIYVAGVERSRSWKALGHDKPWRVSIFGSPFGVACRLGTFETVYDARTAAEKETRRLVSKLAHALGAI